MDFSITIYIIGNLVNDRSEFDVNPLYLTLNIKIRRHMNRVTPQYIDSLKEGEIFVFGSNKEGLHGGGAAAKAFRDFGAEWGVGVGMTGHCYAIPTMDGNLEIIRSHVDGFTAYAKAHPELTFLVTPIGCGIADWRESEIAPLFIEASKLPNVTLPEGFWKIIV